MNNTQPFQRNNKLILGVVLSVITFWLFAQSLVNVVPPLQKSFDTDVGTISIAISLTALFSGMFVVGAGGLADKIGRIKMTNIGLLLSIIGSILIIISNLPLLLIIGRIVQGFSAACIMPSTLALMKAYFQGAELQRALSYWSIGSWGKRYLLTIRWCYSHNIKLAMDFHLFYHCCDFIVRFNQRYTRIQIKIKCNL
ncbi:antibiotic resistance-related transmembrane efflux protein [Staphylococcus agnetis]|nr:antibiotic resistance-related transmembrane efflux protein [Staphylococcus agnetis]